MRDECGDRDWLADRFEGLRPYLTSVGYNMLGSVTEAQDAVQEAWLRLGRSDPALIDDLRAWLTTVVGRICLDMLKARRARREDLVGTWVPEPVFSEPADDGPEDHAVMAESVGLALLVVLESLTPAERLAFVLHDVFAVPFDEVGQIMNRTTEATRQLASRARRRVQGTPRPEGGFAEQRRVVDAFLAAAGRGDFDDLIRVLAPEALLRFDPPGGAVPLRVSGAAAVAGYVLRTAPMFLPGATPAIVNGGPGVLYGTWEEPLCVLGFTVSGGRVAALHLIADPVKLRR